LPLEDNNMPLSNIVYSPVLFVALEILVSALSMKSLWFRNIIEGKPIFVLKTESSTSNSSTACALRLTI
jgi:uncharacterized membrane protein YcaP (DUF421 family)